MQKGDNYQYFSLGIYLIPNYLLMCRRYFLQIQDEKKAVSDDTAFFRAVQAEAYLACVAGAVAAAGAWAGAACGAGAYP